MTACKTLTAGKACKAKGTTLKRVSDATGVSHQTIDNWFKTKPLLFNAIVVYTANLPD